MIPAANNCSTGWTLEYSGFLMAGRPDAGRVSSEYICVDSQLEDRHQPAPGNNNQAVWSHSDPPGNNATSEDPRSTDVWTKKQVAMEVRELSKETTKMTREATKLGSVFVSPVYDDQVKTRWNAVLYGAEYENSPEPQHNLDVTCALCLSPRDVTTMIPGTNTCLPGWTKEYSGHLMSGYHDHAAATEYLCMDDAKDADHASHVNHNGKVFYYVLGQCGSLPCPPYQQDKVITCVVCSK
nr:hypothetical protein BaRGS_029939 [Batillaria attramentaria]